MVWQEIVDVGTAVAGKGALARPRSWCCKVPVVRKWMEHYIHTMDSGRCNQRVWQVNNEEREEERKRLHFRERVSVEFFKFRHVKKKDGRSSIKNAHFC